MRVHAGFWRFVRYEGTDGARAYMLKRRQDCDDTEWLTSRAGRKMRKIWIALKDEIRMAYMRAVPDPTFPVDCVSGVADERIVAVNGKKASQKKHRKVYNNDVEIQGMKKDAPLPQRTQAPREVDAMEFARSTWIKATYYAAVAECAMAFRSLDGVRCFEAQRTFWNAAGASICASLPPTLRDQCARVIHDHIDVMMAIPADAASSSPEELGEQYLEMRAAADRHASSYAEKAQSAIDACVKLRIGNPDVQLPVLLQPGDAHPAFPVVCGSPQPGSTNDKSMPTPFMMGTVDLIQHELEHADDPSPKGIDQAEYVQVESHDGEFAALECLVEATGSLVEKNPVWSASDTATV